MKKFIFTCGDVNGIGPEIILKAINKIFDPSKCELHLICPSNVFEATCSYTNINFPFEINKKIISGFPEKVQVYDIGKGSQSLGNPTKQSGRISFKAINKACEILYKGKADAVITAPVSKTALSLAGYDYPGQTEIFAEWFYTENFAMLFLSEDIKCGLITIHEPIKKISKLLSKQLIVKKIETIIISLILDFGITSPKVAMLGLNPHAGENGRIGKEEIKTIIPAIKKSGFSQFIEGPFVPDAFFGNKLYKAYDLVIGIYHDQVLIPFKLLNFSNGVNFTAGLPIIRTSPDHGTAYDIAGKGIADSGSMESAFRFAEIISSNRLRIKEIAKPSL